MKPDEFFALEDTAARERGDALFALWLQARGDWEGAHEAAQRAGDRDGDWVHAYLHRVEGDEGNARYWYMRAGRRAPAAGTALNGERDAITAELLGK